jgi:hypothetical protein
MHNVPLKTISISTEGNLKAAEDIRLWNINILHPDHHIDFIGWLGGYSYLLIIIKITRTSYY